MRARTFATLLLMAFHGSCANPKKDDRWCLEILVRNCCLDMLCPLYGDYPQVRAMCELNECVSDANKDTNSADINVDATSMMLNKENCAIANCSSANFPPVTINGIDRINSGITPETRDIFASESTKTNANQIRSVNVTETSPRTAKLQFLDVPGGDDMHIQDLALDREYLPFYGFSTLMGYLHPNEFPLELIRDTFRGDIPVHLAAFQLMKSETVAATWIVLWTILALCLPFISLAYLCCPKDNMRRLNEESSDGSLDLTAGSGPERTLAIILHLLLIIFLLPIVMILAGNEQISKAMIQSSGFTKTVFEDLHTFIRNTHMQISFVATSSTDIAIEAIRKDLEDTERLLGLPFRRELAAETRIDSALETLDDIKRAGGEVAALVADLMADCESARAAGSSLQEQLREIARRLTIARQQCLPKDRVLCYTLQYTGLDVTFSCDNLTTDVQIKHLERISHEKSFNDSIDNARKTYEDLPGRVNSQAERYVAEIKNILNRKRMEVYKSAHSLDELARDLSDRIITSHLSTVELVKTVSDLDLWRWAVIVGIAAVLGAVWGLLLCGAPCGCGVTSRTAPFLISGVILSSLICLIVWCLGTAAFVLGGHGQSLICRPLYDHPRYETLGELLDDKGVLYPESGLFGRFLKKNHSNLQVANVLKSCHRNHAAYSAFSLKRLFDVESVSNYQVWSDLRNVFGNFSVGGDHFLEVLSPALQLNLQFLSTVNSVNFTQYRRMISGPVTKRDLGSFADQLGTISRQLIDLGSSERIGNLGLTVRRVARNEMRKLDELRNRILYKITTLEVLIQPLSKQANQSLMHLKNVQYFLDNEAWQIAEKCSKDFTFRLEEYLMDLYDHILTKITNEIGKCKPIWEIFDSIRFYTCKLIVDPLNGIAFFSYLLILLFLGLAPVVLKLALHYREINEELLTSITHRRTRDGLLIDNEGTWATPSSEIPDVEMYDVGPSRMMTPPSRRQPSEPFIPPPPRPMSSLSSRITSPKSQVGAKPKMRSPKRLSTITSRISAARVPQIPSVTRSRSPKRERQDSLRLIDPICWKSG